MHSDYLTTALQATKAAEAVIMHYFGTNPKTQTKADLSPVTIADQEAEETIKKVIKQAFPSHTFYGEEGEKADLTHHRGYTWIIDPIDGTKNYIRGMPLFATLLALLHDGELILGVSNAPAMGELMYAEKGQGCYMNDQRVLVAKTATLEDAYLSFGSVKYFERRELTSSLAELITHRVKWARGIGDFWSYHLLAQGKIDIMIEAETKLWDIAPFKVIIEEAGGRLTQLDGAPMSPAAASCLATNGILHPLALEAFSSQRGSDTL